MSPIQQMLLGVGAVATKTYVDDIFNTYAYTGSSSAQTFNTGVDLANEGGLIWNKYRTMNSPGVLFDTERGKTKVLRISDNDAEGTANTAITSFNNNGFSVGGGDSWTNFNSNHTFANWTFRKAPGFFDIQKYSSGSSNTSGNIGNPNFQVNHDLGCVPGMILIKRTDGTNTWFAWVRGKEGSVSSNTSLGNATALPLADVTSTYFKFSAGNGGYNDPYNYIAYIFAGGESDAATARSVNFDGSTDGLGVANSSDFSFGSGDFTVEGWFKLNQMSSQNGIVNVWRYQDNRRSWVVQTDPASEGGALEFFVNSGGGSGTNHRTAGGTLTVGQWFHFAGVRDGNTIKLFVNGELVDSTSYSSTLYDNTNDPLVIGSIANGTEFANASISNIRITKGQAIYTSSFKVPTEPLTTTSQGAVASNVKLLCCNNSSVTGSTKTPTTISAFDSPTASTDSPFDDPAGFVFGDAGDQNVIKCGRYVGNGNSSPNHIYVGFEPQWVMIKAVNSSGNWWMYDTIRDTAWPPSSEQNDEGKLLYADSSGQEDSTFTIRITATGWYAPYANGGNNQNNDEFTYIAIRRPDGYVGKPADAGTDVFNMAYGTGTDPAFAPGFPVDFTFLRRPGTTENWTAAARLIQGQYLHLNSTASENSDSNIVFDYNNGFHDGTGFSTYLSWSWKRHAGFDVVCYEGNAVAGRPIPHSLSKIPEMIWLKSRTSADQWVVGHKGLNGGTNPWHYWLKLQSDAAESNSINNWNDQAPTSTHFIIDDDNRVNKDGDGFIAMLFASVDGISKVGYYTGTGSSNSQAITLGFQPRFVLVKRVNAAEDWFMFDSVRGMGSGNDPYLRINKDNDQSSSFNILEATSTGFTLQANMSGPELNNNNDRFIYYAHA